MKDHGVFFNKLYRCITIKKIIVTGASGNLGLHLLKSIPYETLAITRDNWNELKNIKASEFDSVIHCAYDLKHNINKTPSIVLESNVISTAKLLEICLEKKIKNFVFISSCAVYGESSNSSEDKPCQPITMNGHIKAFNEELVKSFCLANGIDYLILRPFNSYGGNDHFSVVQRIIRASKEKNAFTLSNEGVAERDFIHVEDIAIIIAAILEKNLKNEILNIGSGESVRIIDIVKAVENKFGEIEISNIVNTNETIYSRANIKKLKKIINFKARNIFDYIATL